MSLKTIACIVLTLGGMVACVVGMNKEYNMVIKGQKSKEIYAFIALAGIGVIFTCLPRVLRHYIESGTADLIGRLTAAAFFAWAGYRSMKADRIYRDNN